MLLFLLFEIYFAPLVFSSNFIIRCYTYISKMSPQKFSEILIFVCFLKTHGQFFKAILWAILPSFLLSVHVCTVARLKYDEYYQPQISPLDSEDQLYPYCHHSEPHRCCCHQLQDENYGLDLAQISPEEDDDFCDSSDELMAAEEARLNKLRISDYYHQQPVMVGSTVFRLRFLGSVEVEEETRARCKRLKKHMVEEAVTKIKVQPQGVYNFKMPFFKTFLHNFNFYKD